MAGVLNALKDALQRTNLVRRVLRSGIYVLVLHGYRGKVAVVTGAASGLGRALTRELVSRQCHLALLDVDVSLFRRRRWSLAELASSSRSTASMSLSKRP